MFCVYFLINYHIMLLFRNTTIEDLDEIYALECETYGKYHWSKESFKNELTQECSRYLVCESSTNKKEILGFTGYWLIGNEGHITTMVIGDQYRNNHLADILLYTMIGSAVQNRINWLTLEVRISNIAAINLYVKYKFKQLGIRKKYYQNNNEDALILWTDDILKPTYINFLNNQLLYIKEKIGVSDISQYVPLKKRGRNII